LNHNQLTHIEKIEADLWSAADSLRANSKLTAGEYCMPVLGVIFLRHATNRYNEALRGIEADQAAGKMPKRPLTAADFKKRRALMLPPEARYDYLTSLPKNEDLGTKLVAAMETIESNFPALLGQLPKDYTRFENILLEELLKKFNSDVLQTATGDIFGRINEYFLMKFAIQGAQDNGEFFTPPSLVQVIVNVIEPDHGIVFDPACGSGGMFVQTSHFIEQHGKQTAHRVTFYGHEFKTSNLRLALMNLAVHGLEGSIKEANTFYDDPHELYGKCDFVMANPPFNVDKVDAEKIKIDRRLPFGLPGVNKDKQVSNGNYLWISYFYSYLNPTGRAGFVMSSQASSAGHTETEVRRKLIETGHVDVMIAIRSNFFYTRTVPCELWHFDRGKPEDRRNHILMIDARNIYRKITRKIFDFSPEQLQNITAIVWLYRGHIERYLDLVAGYCCRSLDEGQGCFSAQDDYGQEIEPLPSFIALLSSLCELLAPFIQTLPAESPHIETLIELNATSPAFKTAVDAFHAEVTEQQTLWKHQKTTNGELKKAVDRLAPIAETSRNLVKQTDHLYKLVCRLIDICQNECKAGDDDVWVNRDIVRARKAAEQARQIAVEQLKQVRYFWKQAHWLTKRFPEAKYCDVKGLVKLVDKAEIAANDWSLTPGRYVGVAPEEADENFDFEEVLRNIHVELDELNAEAVLLAETIKKNFVELGLQEKYLEVLLH
jgi:type I restriction enzyme M protein